MSGRKNIVITGATGTIGQALVEELLPLGHNIIVVVRNLEKSTQLFSDRVSHVVFDGDAFSCELSFYNPEIVIHLASTSTSYDDKKSIVGMVNSNILFVSLLLDALKNTTLKLFVNAGSFSEFYSNDANIDPTYFYSATKTASRYIIDYFSKVNNFVFVNAIIYSVYGKRGERKKLFDFMIDAIGSKEPIPMSEGYQVLDFIHVEDVVRFYTLLIQNYTKLQDNYSEYHVGTGKGASIRELAKICHDLCNVHPNILWGAVESRKRDTVIATATQGKAFMDIGWEASISLEEGIKKYLVEHGRSNAVSI